MRKFKKARQLVLRFFSILIGRFGDEVNDLCYSHFRALAKLFLGPSQPRGGSRLITYKNVISHEPNRCDRHNNERIKRVKR
jgi:hypothetical protein